MIDLPPRTSRLVDATPFFYGWVVLGAATISIMMMSVSQTFTISIFVDSFIDNLGISRANLSLIYGLATLLGASMLPLTGRLIDQHGPRMMVTIIAVLLGLACISTSFVNGLITLFMCFTALRFFGFGSLQLVSNNVVAQWFIRRRGLVMGLAAQSFAVSLFVFPGLAEFLIAQFTWRGAWIALGLMVWGIVLPVGWFLYRDKPELYGLRPDGDAQPTALDLPTSEENWTVAEARQTGAFWLFMVGLSCVTMIASGLLFHHISLLEVRGLSRETAVFCLQMVAVASVVGNLGMGRLMDLFPPRWLLSLTMMSLAAATALVQLIHTPFQAMLYGALLGLVVSSYRVIDSVVWAKYYGRQNLGAIKGFTMFSVIGATALGPYPMGLSYDYLNSYTPGLLVLIIVPITIGVVAPMVPRPARENITITAPA